VNQPPVFPLDPIHGSPEFSRRTGSRRSPWFKCMVLFLMVWWGSRCGRHDGKARSTSL